MTDAEAAAGTPVASPAPDLLAGASCAAHPGEGATVVCSRCGDFACGACVFSPLAGKEVCVRCAADGLPQPVPWERRKELGWRKAYWETTKLVMKEPTAFYKTPATEEGLLGPVLYGVVSYTVGNTLYALLLGLMMLGAGGVSAVAMPEPEMGGFMLAYFGCIGLAIVPMTIFQAPVQAMIGIVVAGGAAHLTLWMLKSAKADFEASIRAVSFANAGYLVLAVPCIGFLMTIGYVIWAEIVGLREAHGVGNDKAVMAALGFRVALFLLVVGVYAAIFAVSFASAAPR